MKCESTYVLDDHDQEGQLDCKGLLGIYWASDVVSGDIGAHNFENRGLNIRISYSLNMTISHVLMPDLEGFGSN